MREQGKYFVVFKKGTGKKPVTEGRVEDVQAGDVVSFYADGGRATVYVDRVATGANKLKTVPQWYEQHLLRGSKILRFADIIEVLRPKEAKPAPTPVPPPQVPLSDPVSEYRGKKKEDRATKLARLKAAATMGNPVGFKTTV